MRSELPKFECLGALMFVQFQPIASSAKRLTDGFVVSLLFSEKRWSPKTNHANKNIDDSNRKECAWNVHRFDHFHTSLPSPATIAGVIFNLFISGDVDGFLLVSGERLSGRYT